MKRRIAREKALQSLFQIDVSQLERDEAIGHVLEEGEERDSFLIQLVEGTIEHLEDIDSIIREHLENWSFDRIGNIDRSVLRIAVYEMKYLEEIPINVTFNEAIDLAKIFGGDESGRFVNAVLSKISKTIQ
ncbi:transcription antitermination factor NusB [Pseudalkalibacillus berkeleyi]|uniref:Transcription antitermination protein NusB n=1 Tax=Pseudalkalibacillus berkeleyi TaxID=1069813 RepID=A0ABS9H189_9BACL|nr:transcription antitermination factor NusB [Pseudalkalibacillus berkeleyi]MCF6137851.1 transcription antitermination factor NusB [Pseudalkalibacillus berkeleyi]